MPIIAPVFPRLTHFLRKTWQPDLLLDPHHRPRLSKIRSRQDLLQPEAKADFRHPPHQFLLHFLRPNLPDLHFLPNFTDL